jgi:PAT family beta-lactamase induction signal transducer AmpG
MVLTENRLLRFLVATILYVAQGLPLGLFYYALPAWQAQNGASAAAVGGVLALTALPWSLKLINGIVMDRFAFLAMGRRRPWVIVGQTAIVLGLLGLAWANPGARDAAVLGAFSFGINVATTIQDVAIDGLAVDIVPHEEFGRINGFMFGGQAVGMAIGASLSGYMIAHHGFSAAMLGLASLVGTVLLVIVIVASARENGCSRGAKGRPRGSTSTSMSGPSCRSSATSSPSCSSARPWSSFPHSSCAARLTACSSAWPRCSGRRC